MAGPALWDGPSGKIVYLWCEADFLKGFRLNERSLETAPFVKGAIANHGSPGGALTVSSDGKQPRTGIVWVTHTNNKSADHGNAPGVLRAFDAETLAEIWNSEQTPERDRLGTLVKFVPPLVVAGKVYIPSYDNAVHVYGTLGK
jgi:outer membrane protein assembly factor BamB